MSPWRRLRDEDRGEVSTTVVLVPCVLVIIMAVIQAALVFQARSVVTAAAFDAARAVQVEGGQDADGLAVADQLLAGSDDLLTGPTVDIRSTPGGTVTVEVSAGVTTLLPGWRPRVSGRAEGVREAFRSEDQR